MEGKLHTAWRQMLRYVFRIHRQRGASPDGDPEVWVNFVQRAAHKSEELAQFSGDSQHMQSHKSFAVNKQGQLPGTLWSDHVVCGSLT